MAPTSLWLGSTKPTRVRLWTRFAAYPHFLAILGDRLELALPDTVEVTFVPLEDLNVEIRAHSSEDKRRQEAFIDQVDRRLRAGDDVPPLLLRDGRVYDGRHRVLAARRLGLTVAPVIVTDPFWSS